MLLSPTSCFGPDRGNKRDNHASIGFKTEGDEMRRFLGAQPNLIVINGDRHWQYRSVDPVTGLREFGCGPSSDVHAGRRRRRQGHSELRPGPGLPFNRAGGGYSP